MVSTAAVWLLGLAAAGLVAALGEATCDAGEECPSDFDSLLQVNLEVQRSALAPIIIAPSPKPTASALPAIEPLPAPEPRRPANYFRQKLYNAADLQYSGDMTLGGQVFRAVLDTGSFELLVFGKDCSTCGTSGSYDYRKSKTYVTGRLTTVHSFGSGSLKCLDGYDKMEIANYTVTRQDFWEVVEAKMPVLNSASFQAIAGLGPPGQPQKSAQSMMQGSSENKFISSLILEKNDSMLMNMGVRYFSACFEWTAGAPGHLIWNDTPPKEQTVEFNEINVVDDSYWEVPLRAPRFSLAATNATNSSTVMLGCEKSSCKALLDTGTSLIAVPGGVFNKALASLNNLSVDCTNLKQMPSLEFELGNYTYTLPAQAYIGIIEGYVDRTMRDMLNPRPKTAPVACQLLLMNSDGMGEDLWILGMPFFRYYYTTFDLGPDPYDYRTRRIWTAPATVNCTPALPVDYQEKMNLARERDAWRVNATMIREPSMDRKRREGRGRGGGGGGGLSNSNSSGTEKSVTKIEDSANATLPGLHPEDPEDYGLPWPERRPTGFVRKEG